MTKTGSVINFFEKEIPHYVSKMRPPIPIRNEFDIGFSFSDQTLELFEIRPRWNDKTIIDHISFARTKYVKSQGAWKIYWMRASGRWELYPEKPMVKTLNEFFTLVEEDAYGCFKG